MDRLEKIKGYADRAPKDDVKWLISEVTQLRTRVGVAEVEAENAWRTANALLEENARLKGEAPARRCPCGFPDDHAGWCPHR